MATVIYNHREMEYKCRRYWQESGNDKPDFCGMLPKDDKRFARINHKLDELNHHVFDEDYAMDYGMDTLRLYVLFETYPENEEEWKEGTLEGIYKFLNRFMTLVENSVRESMGIAHNEKKALRHLEKSEADNAIRQEMQAKRNSFIKKYETALERDHFHGIVAAFMEYSTSLAGISKKYAVCIDKKVLRELVILLAPYAPFMSEYLWQQLTQGQSVFKQEYLLETTGNRADIQTRDVAVQINGKTKKVIQVSEELSQEQMMRLVGDTMGMHLPEQIDRVVYVPGKVFNMILHQG